MKLSELGKLHPREVRELIRKGEVDLPTSGMSEGYLQANLAILPKNMPTIFYSSLKEIQSLVQSLKF